MVPNAIPAIKHLALQRGITAREISKRCGVCEPTAQRWLFGLAVPRSKAFLSELELLFDCPAGALFKRITITVERRTRRSQTQHGDTDHGDQISRILPGR